MRIIHLLVALSIGLTSASADVLYDFSVSPTEGIQPFDLNFNSPSFVGNDQTFSIPSVTITDGTHSWSLVHGGATSNLGFACFGFGTSAVTLFVTGCGSEFNPSSNVAFLEVAFVSLPALPTTDGVFTNSATYQADIFGYSGTTRVVDSGANVTLTISQVPEPSATLPAMTMILGYALLRVVQRRRSPQF